MQAPPTTYSVTRTHPTRDLLWLRPRCAHMSECECLAGLSVTQAILTIHTLCFWYKPKRSELALRSRNSTVLLCVFHLNIPWTGPERDTNYYLCV